MSAPSTSPVFDAVIGSYHNPTPAQRRAMARLERLAGATLATGSTWRGTLEALERKGYAERRAYGPAGSIWDLTPLGVRVLAAIDREGGA